MALDISRVCSGPCRNPNCCGFVIFFPNEFKGCCPNCHHTFRRTEIIMFFIGKTNSKQVSIKPKSASIPTGLQLYTSGPKSGGPTTKKDGDAEKNKLQIPTIVIDEPPEEDLEPTQEVPPQQVISPESEDPKEVSSSSADVGSTNAVISTSVSDFSLSSDKMEYSSGLTSSSSDVFECAASSESFDSMGHTERKAYTEDISVEGISNRLTKILSQTVHTYDIDPSDGRLKLRTEIGEDALLDLGYIGRNTFHIKADQLDMDSFGRDKTGSCGYLTETLQEINKFNDNVETMAPLHVDGDGHCLVHSISRCLIGFQLYWYSLRIAMEMNMCNYIDKYKELLSNFIHDTEWELIIQECRPNHLPSTDEMIGLRTVHVFALANVIKRPIILYDNLVGMKSSGEYAATFLPVLFEPNECVNSDGSLRKPICIAWSSTGRNHFVPLVPIADRSHRVPEHLIPPVWAVSEELKHRYIAIENGGCHVGGEEITSVSQTGLYCDTYSLIYRTINDIDAHIITDYLYMTYDPPAITEGVPSHRDMRAMNLLLDRRKLLMCIYCRKVYSSLANRRTMRKNGSLYAQALSLIPENDSLLEDHQYCFPIVGLCCNYDSRLDELIPVLSEDPNCISVFLVCDNCHNESLRCLTSTGEVVLLNGDVHDGKYFWYGSLCTKLPKTYDLNVTVRDVLIKDRFTWFSSEDENSEDQLEFISQNLMKRHFPKNSSDEDIHQEIMAVVISIVEDSELPKCVVKRSVQELPPFAMYRSCTVPKFNMAGICSHPLSRLGAAAPATATAVIINDDTAETGSINSDFTDISNRDMYSCDTFESPDHHPGIVFKDINDRMIKFELNYDLSIETIQDRISYFFGIPKANHVYWTGEPPVQLSQKDMTDVFSLIKYDVILVTSSQKLGDDESESKPPTDGDAAMDEDSKDDKSNQKGSEDRDRDRDRGSEEKGNDDMDLEPENNNPQEPVDVHRVDARLMALFRQSSQARSSIWPYICYYPFIIRPGGLLFDAALHFMPLVHKNLYQLPLIPDKIFIYNKVANRMEPYCSIIYKPNRSSFYSIFARTQFLADLKYNIELEHNVISARSKYKPIKRNIPLLAIMFNRFSDNQIIVGPIHNVMFNGSGASQSCQYITFTLPI